VTNGGGSRFQSLVGHSRAEAAVGHGGSGTGVEVRVREGGKAEADPCEGGNVTRASVPQNGRFEY
jgi:hypothetical protein